MPRQCEDEQAAEADGTALLMLAGDVMTGRGIDQALPHPSSPRIYESFVRDARRYVSLAEQENGAFRRPLSWETVWGSALPALQRLQPDARIINLETAITTSDDYWRGKGINYRMHPKNLPALLAAGIEVAALGNNHTLDWGYTGLMETIEVLEAAGVVCAGAGTTDVEAAAPAIVELEKERRIVVFSYASKSSGVPSSWAAAKRRPGVNRLPDFSEKTMELVVHQAKEEKRPGDVVIASFHWGGNWGYEIPFEQRDFAHRLIEGGAIDVVHGHSSHHFKGIEVYQGKLILYGCGDVINDYEGIGGDEAYRGDLGLIYFPRISLSTGKLRSMKLLPTRMRRFRLTSPQTEEREWMRSVLDREGEALGTRAVEGQDGFFELVFDAE